MIAEGWEGCRMNTINPVPQPLYSAKVRWFLYPGKLWLHLAHLNSYKDELHDTLAKFVERFCLRFCIFIRDYTILLMFSSVLNLLHRKFVISVLHPQFQNCMGHLPSNCLCTEWFRLDHPITYQIRRWGCRQCNDFETVFSVLSGYYCICSLCW